jgi:hypothetical protein
MKAYLLISCLFAVTVIGTPAKRNCPQQQFVKIKDNCGGPVNEYATLGLAIILLS